MEQKIFGVIYKITNLVNGKAYIGQTIDFERRIARHRSLARPGKSNLPIYNAIRKYGCENFTVEVIYCVVDRDLLNELEKFFIKEHKSKDLDFGYNLTEGGDGFSGYFHSEEHRRKLSIIAKNRKFSKETRQKMSTSNKNWKRSEGTKQNMSISQSKWPVIQFSSSGDVLCEYVSMALAERTTDISQASISMCCNGKRKSAGGFLWGFAEKESKLMIPEKIKPSKCQVEQFSLLEKLVTKFISMMEAERATGVNQGSISKCCQGKQKTAGGFVWRYANKEQTQ